MQQRSRCYRRRALVPPLAPAPPLPPLHTNCAALCLYAPPPHASQVLSYNCDMQGRVRLGGLLVLEGACMQTA